MLNWFYDRSLEGGIEMKATCAPHYFRVVRQRRAAEHRSEAAAAAAHAAPPVEAAQHPASPAIGPTEMAMPGSTGIELKPQGIGRPVGHPGIASFRHERHDQGMPGRNRGVFHLSSGRGLSLRIFASLGGGSAKTTLRRHLGKLSGIQRTARCQQPKGKCGCCEFRNVCMGCRARAYAATGNYLDEEPFCVYEPKAKGLKKEKDTPAEVAR